MKVIRFFVALLLSFNPFALPAQVSGTNIQSGYGFPLNSGTICFGSTCGTVTNGSFSFALSAGTYAVVLVDSRSVTLLTMASVVVPSSGLSTNSYLVPATATISGFGVPYLSCVRGAVYTRTDGGRTYTCTSQNGLGVWTERKDVVPAVTSSSAGGVASVNGATGVMTIVAGSGVTISTVGNTITISAPGAVIPGTPGQVLASNGTGGVQVTGMTDNGTDIISSKAFTTTGAHSTNVPGSATLDYFTGQTRILSQGSNTATNGTFYGVSLNSDSSTVRIPFNIDSFGNSSFASNVNTVIYQGVLATPSSSTAPCAAGTFVDDANFHYVCVASGSWKRVALAAY